MQPSRHTIAMRYAVATWPIRQVHNDEGLMTLQCGLCADDLIPGGGWPTAYTFTIAELARAIEVHEHARSAKVRDKRSDHPQEQAQRNQVHPGGHAGRGEKEA